MVDNIVHFFNPITYFGLWISSLFIFNFSFIISILLAVRGIRLFYHYDPIDTEQIKLVAQHGFITSIILCLVNFPIMGYLIERIPFIQMALYLLLIGTDIKVSHYAYIIKLIIPTSDDNSSIVRDIVNHITSHPNMSIGECIVFICNPKHYLVVFG